MLKRLSTFREKRKTKTESNRTANGAANGADKCSTNSSANGHASGTNSVAKSRIDEPSKGAATRPDSDVVGANDYNSLTGVHGANLTSSTEGSKGAAQGAKSVAQTAGNSTGVTSTKGFGTSGVDGTYDSQPAGRRRSSGFFPIQKKSTSPVNRSSTEDAKNTNPSPRQEVDGSFDQFAQLVHASRRPLPTQTGDGTYIEHDVHSSLFQDMKSLGYKDVQTLINVMRNKASGSLVDDKTMIMEKTIQLVAALPAKSKTRVDLTNAFIDELWYTLDHPPLNHQGDEYNYRKADGSGNNPMFPKMGAANTAYARSVIPETIQPGSLPDPGLIFDAVFKRSKYREHPNKVSSILYYWAGIIIHDLFQTNHEDFSLSQTSSYLDLSVLYGDNQEEQNNIRTFRDGKIKPDCFAEKRIFGMPPATGVLLIMFNRFHNYVVEQLAQINENGRFNKPREGLDGTAKEKAWTKYDNDLFQTGRLITCGLYINITLHDYLRTIVGLNRVNSTWTLDPRTKMGKTTLGMENAPRGVGNQVSAEFNLVYRWHSNISAKDEKWTEGLFQQLFQKPAADVTLPELLAGLSKWEHSMDKDPFKRPFHGLKRDPSGKFSDDELVVILSDAIEDLAGDSGANHVPACMKAIEILGMQQARAWRCATLNEFRKFFGLKPHETFEDINSDPMVADQLRHLYEHPDYVEMYPGIISEEAKSPMDPGVGICPTYTISRAVLSDAVALVRADRFYTTDYHAKNLTNWGYSEAQYDLNVEQGCVFSKLFLRAFPAHFKPNSIYAHYPMVVPSENHKIMTKLGRVAHYDYSRPAFIKPRINLTSFAGANYMLNRPQDFKVTWGEATGFVMGKGGFDFMLSGDTPFHSEQKKTMARALYKNNWHKEIKTFYEHITLRLLHENTAKIAGVNQVDITRDVGNIAHVHFAAKIFNLPLKSDDNPKGVFTEHELYAIVAVVFIAIFFDFEPTKSFPLRMAAQALGQKLGKLIEMNVKSTSMTGWVSGLVDGLREYDSPLRDYGVHMVRKLLESGLGVYEVAWSQILPVATAMIPNQAQVFTQALDFYLSPEGAQHLPRVIQLAHTDTEAADEELMKYVMEGIRLFGTFGSYREATVACTIDDGGRSVPIKAGDKVFCSFVSANRDPARFPDPNAVRTDRPLESYIHYGIGPHQCLGMEASRVGLTAMFRTVFRSCKNLRRAPGAPGQMKKVPRPGGFYVYMTEQHTSYFPFPTTWKLHYDGKLPPVPNYHGK